MCLNRIGFIFCLSLCSCLVDRPVQQTPDHDDGCTACSEQGESSGRSEPRAAGDPTERPDTRAGEPLRPSDPRGDALSGDEPDSGDIGSGDALVGDVDPESLPAAFIVSFGVAEDGLAADGGEDFVDIRIVDTERLGSQWRLMSATYCYINEQLRGEQLPWVLEDGDLLRFHGPEYSGSTDVEQQDNNADRWDLKAPGGFGINFKHGIIWLEASDGTMIDIVSYETERNQLDWLYDSGLSPLLSAVANGLWPGSEAENAFSFTDSERHFARLVDSSRDGNRPADWEEAGGDTPFYYADAMGKTGNELKAALNRIIKNHNILDYDDLLSVFLVTDPSPEDPNEALRFYTGDSNSGYNREHVWAKSHGGFGDASYAGYSDLHNLRPTRHDVNHARWHLDFAEGGELYSDTQNRIVEDYSFEPRDEVKGDVARTLFYMAVRYEGDDGNMPDLELVDEIPSLLNSRGEPDNDYHTQTPRHGKLSTLLQWHVQDPPDERERQRNDVVYELYQHNRNPFVDHPEWVYEIWGGPQWPH